MASKRTKKVYEPTDEDIKKALKKYPWPDVVTKAYAQVLSKELGVEIRDGCWFGQTYGREALAKRIIELAETGNPIDAAIHMYYNRIVNIQWVTKFIENRYSSNAAKAAVMLVRSGDASVEWAQKIVENNPYSCDSAVELYKLSCADISIEWVKKIIKKQESGASQAVVWLWPGEKGITLKYVKKVIEDDINGPSAMAAVELLNTYKTMNVDYEDMLKWVKNVIKNSENKINSLKAVKLLIIEIPEVESCFYDEVFYHRKRAPH